MCCCNFYNCPFYAWYYKNFYPFYPFNPYSTWRKLPYSYRTNPPPSFIPKKPSTSLTTEQVKNILNSSRNKWVYIWFKNGTGGWYIVVTNADENVGLASEHTNQGLSVLVNTIDNVYSSEIGILISAFMDGRSNLHIKSNTIWWEHFDYDKPGTGVSNKTEKESGLKNNLPTYINLSKWYPIWNGKISNFYNLRQANINIPKKYDIVYNVRKARNSIKIIQYPSSNNNYETIIEFNDNPTWYSDWYQVVLYIIPQ